MFWTLMRKEFRLLRPATIAAVIIALLFYGVVWPTMTYVTRTQGEPLDPWNALTGSALFALALSSVLAAAFGGAALPTERRERWADFASMLPISRTHAVLARLLAGSGLCLTVWAAHAALLTVLWWQEIAVLQTHLLRLKADSRIIQDLGVHSTNLYLTYLSGTALSMVALFGIAWLLSTFVRSAAISVSAAIGLFVGGLVSVLLYAALQHADEGSLVPAYLDAAAGVGVITLMIGTIVAVRRVEP